MPSGAVRPGGRTAETRRKVHDAVRALLDADPDAPIRIRSVASRSGVDAATVYRRWGSADALVLDVLVEDLQTASPVPATGDVRGDLLAYARQVRDDVDRPGGLRFLQAISAVGTSAGGEAVARDLLGRRLDAFAALVTAAESEDLDLDPVDVVHGVLAPITYRRMLLPRTGLTDGELERIVDGVLAAARARRRPTARGSE